MIPNWKIYPRSQGHSTVYLKNVITDPAIEVGDYTVMMISRETRAISSAEMCCTTIRSAITTG